MARIHALRSTLKRIAAPMLNPRFLLCFGVAWMITNGWSYVVFAIGTLLGIGWMSAVGGAYMTFLWLPFTPEKLVTLTIAILLLRWLFPRDEKTLGALREMVTRLKQMRKKEKDRPSVPHGQAQEE